MVQLTLLSGFCRLQHAELLKIKYRIGQNAISQRTTKIISLRLLLFTQYAKNI